MLIDGSFAAHPGGPSLPDRQYRLVLAYGAAIIASQFPKHDRRDDRQTPEDEERTVYAVNHLRRVGVESVGNEDCGDE